MYCHCSKNLLYKGVASVGKKIGRMATMSTAQVEPGTRKEAKLPPLPVPALNDTLSKYLRTVKPLLSPEAFKKTTEIVMKFGTEGEGQKLQGLLENKGNSVDNWMADWWLNTAYLEYRDPVVVFSSPGLVFPLQHFSSLDQQLSYAAKMIFGAISYKEMIDSGNIKGDFMGKVPLDMSQYKKIFGTTRNPAVPRDVLKYYPNSKHIVVAHKNYFFKVNVIDDGGNLKKPFELFNELHKIVESTSELSGVPVGILTSEHRDSWAKAFEMLKKDANNVESLKVIEEALFIVSIDKPNTAVDVSKSTVSSKIEDEAVTERQSIAALQMLHGNITNSGNRWFDKTISFVVGTKGEVGLTYEHSPAEGPPIANMMDFIVQYMNTNAEPLKRDKLLFDRIQLNRLEFHLKEKELNTAIAKASDKLNKLVKDIQMAPFTFKKYGREFIKSCSMSPDSFIQMGIQAAFYRLHKVPAAHYESASVRMFSGGRTECIRSCSLEAVEFSKALVDSSLSLQEKFRAMKNAVESHKRYAADAVRGQGIDRHLLGLKKIAVENGMSVPELFLDDGYIKSSSFRLSTSQVPSLFEAFMCYGPLTTDGYGCCYNPLKNSIVFGISAFNSNPETDASKFKNALQKTLCDMEIIGMMAHAQSKL